jgi:hypothetical protein
MNVSELSENLAIIQQLRDHPNDEDGLTPDELKAKFDEAAGIIKEYLNEIIVPAVNRAVSKDENGDVNIGGKEFTAGTVIVCSDPDREGFYMKSSLEGDDNARPVAEMNGTNDDDTPVIIRNIAPGINDNDAVNKKQLEDTTAPLIVTIYQNDSFDLVATLTPDEIYNALLSRRKVFLQTNDGYFPCVLAEDSRAMFAQVDYEEGKILGYYVLEDGTAEAIEKVIAFTYQVPRIDDDVVAPDKIWSSKNTVDKLCPSFAKSGTFVQCEPVEGYPLNIVADTEKQVRFTVCGKNLYDQDTYPLEDNTLIRWDSGSELSSNSYASTDYIPVSHLRGQQIAIRHCPYVTAGGSTSAGIAFYDDTKTYINDKSGTNRATTTVPTNASFMRFSINKEAKYKSEAQIEIGSTVTYYEPYWKPNDIGEGSSVVVAAGKGVNSVFCYDGEQPVKITVTGKSDPVAIIEKLTKAVVSLGGNV